MIEKIKEKLKEKNIQEYALAAISLIFIVNGVLACAILFDKIDVSVKTAKMVGSITFSYSFLAMCVLVFLGVKGQSKPVKRK